MSVISASSLLSMGEKQGLLLCQSLRTLLLYSLKQSSPINFSIQNGEEIHPFATLSRYYDLVSVYIYGNFIIQHLHNPAPL